MEIMHLFNSLKLDDVVVQLFSVDIVGSGFHNYPDAILEDWNCGQKNKYREDVRADWISLLPFWSCLKLQNE